MVFYFCDICDFETEGKALYKRHILTGKHSKRCEVVKDSKFICDRCNYKFISQEQLDEHCKRNIKTFKSANSIFF